jgi:DNA-directed RNA polymerase specialized sigma24 family protein
VGIDEFRTETRLMKKEWVITQEAFDGLLGWLDSDREQAAQKYEKIRTRLIKIFTCRGCAEADELADETINRVTAKVDSIVNSYSGDPAHYFYGVAQKVHLEYLRSRRVLQNQLGAGRELTSINVVALDDDIEQEYACLERCMDQLPPENRRLVLEYYQEEKRAKIDRRHRLAKELGIAVNALRIRAHRIRLQLQQCMQACLEQSPAH